jgi:hypothetical protein
MGNRLSGLLLILRALAPFLFVATLYWGITRMAADFQVALRPLARIEAEVDALGVTIDTARNQFEAARADVDAAVALIQSFQVPDILPDLPANLGLPALDIPTVNVPIVPTVSVQFTNATGSVTRTIDGACRTVFSFLGIPSTICDAARTVTDAISFSYPSGISVGTTNFTINFPQIPAFSVPMPPLFQTIADELDDVFSVFDGIFGRLENTMTSITDLGIQVSGLPENFQTIGSAGQEIAENLSTVGQQRAGLVMLAAVVIVVLLVIYLSVGVLDDLLRGLVLLLGRTPPAIDNNP